MNKEGLSKKELAEAKRYYKTFCREEERIVRKEKYNLDDLDKSEDTWYN